jgi:muramoyltetrapeptide carboxypeptidase
MRSSRQAVSRLTLPAVPRGARVAVVSPASYPQPENLAKGVQALSSLGYQPVLGRHALEKANGYFAGTAAERAEDLHAAFLDPTIRAIFCTRGGYGSNYLLDLLDLELIRANPKPFLGYSDMTSIQTWLLDQIGLTAFHGPLVAGDFSVENRVETASLFAALGAERWMVGRDSGLRTLRQGKTSGALYGGCLTLLAASLGTRYAPQTEGKLLFLEDLNVRPYQLDRLLRQMLLAGKFEGVVGVVFGEMLQSLGPGESPGFLEAMILRVLECVDGPIAIGLRSGHVSHGNVTLAFGIEAELNLEGEPRLAFAERATDP